MKKAMMALALLAATPAAFATTGSVTLTGEVESVTCSMAVIDPVTMPTIKTNFTGVSEDRTFSVALSDCDTGIDTAKVTFGGTADGEDATLHSTGIDGLAVQVSESGAATDKIGFGETGANIEIASSAATQDYAVKYVSTGSKITSGTANSTIEMTVAYE